MEYFDFDFDFEDEKTSSFDAYKVTIAAFEYPYTTVNLVVWAESIENAQTCGEVLSAVYL